MEVVEAGVDDGGVSLDGDGDDAADADGVDEGDAGGAANGDGGDGAGQEHAVTKGKQGERSGL
jgi:hypothetical protein